MPTTSVFNALPSGDPGCQDAVVKVANATGLPVRNLTVVATGSTWSYNTASAANTAVFVVASPRDPKDGNAAVAAWTGKEMTKHEFVRTAVKVAVMPEAMSLIRAMIGAGGAKSAIPTRLTEGFHEVISSREVYELTTPVGFLLSYNANDVASTTSLVALVQGARPHSIGWAPRRAVVSVVAYREPVSDENTAS